MRRITKAALGGLATSALIMAATQAASGESPIITYPPYSAPLVDLQTGVDGPFDGATATLLINQAPDGTNFKLTINGIDPNFADVEYGAHLHVGPCVEDKGGDALGHYNDGGGISDDTEVWFELVPNDFGTATDSTSVPFIPVDPDGIMSIVIHQESTDKKSGFAGPRQACLPLYVPQWIPESDVTE